MNRKLDELNVELGEALGSRADKLTAWRDKGSQLRHAIECLAACVALLYCTVGTSGQTLVAHWKLDEESGTSVADAAGSNTGSVVGTQQWVAGRIGGAFDFDEATRVTVGTDNALNLTSAGTIAAWISPDDVGESGGRIFSRNTSSTGYEFHLASAARFLVFHSDNNGSAGGSISSSNVVPAGEWSHVAAVWSGGTATIYINGQSNASGSVTISSASNEVAVIGGDEFEARDFDGRIDDLRIYDSALSATQILGIVNSSRARYYHQQNRSN